MIPWFLWTIVVCGLSLLNLSLSAHLAGYLDKFVSIIHHWPFVFVLLFTTILTSLSTYVLYLIVT